MEYRIEKLFESLSNQREQLITELISLNENLPNYNDKFMKLEMQISNIDMKINDYLYVLKDLEFQKLNNDLTIKQLKN